MTAPLATHELLSLIVDEAPQAMLVLSPAGMIWSWGRAAEALFGWTAEEAMGQPLERLIKSSPASKPKAGFCPALAKPFSDHCSEVKSWRLGMAGRRLPLVGL